MARKVIQRAGGDQTRERILAVSERLFSAFGYDGVSMRQIGTEADIPFALVTYHFKTKLGLYQAVFSKRIAGFRDHRRDLLMQVVIGPDIYQNFLAIAAAFVGPMMGLRDVPNGPQFGQLLAREIFDPNEASRGVVAEHLDPLAKLTIELLHEAAPEASKAEIARAYHFATGALAVNYSGSERLKRISDLDEGILETGDTTNQLVRFMAAGLMFALYSDTASEMLARAGTADRRAHLVEKPELGPAGASGRSSARQRYLATLP